MGKVDVILQNCTHFTDIPTPSHFQHWVDITLNTVSQIHSPSMNNVTIRIVHAEESAELNQNFRHKPNPTNVLAFPEQTIPGIQTDSLGDIAICYEVVIAEASTHHVKPMDHFAHLTIHGLLHLLGYDHLEPSDATIMEGLEIKILSQLNIANPYQTIDALE